MRNKCKPGVICIQNISIIIGMIIFFSIGYLLYCNLKSNTNLYISNKEVKQELNQQPTKIQPQQININNYSDYESAYNNPYNPPFRNDGYSMVPIVPINVSTNIGAVSTSFKQLGILTPVSQNSKDNILSLMGRPLFTSRNKFQYYTISNQNNQVKLPVSVKGKSGLDEYGVDEVFDGDTVYVEGYEDVFKVTKYDNGTIRYLPVI
jgi:hypothetical protein